MASLSGREFPRRQSRRLDRIRSDGLPPGPHGIHLHVSGNCDPKTGFTSAGPILALIPGKQRLPGRRRAAGGRPAQPVRGRGRSSACQTLINSFGLGNGKRSIFDRDGVAIILDQRGDDYRSQPLGKAGARIACGVVIRTQGPLPASAGSWREDGPRWAWRSPSPNLPLAALIDADALRHALTALAKESSDTGTLRKEGWA